MSEGAADAIRFYFDFSSPYGYLASARIDDLAARHARAVTWHPFLLGAVFKINGMQPLMDVPMKGAYSRHDMARSARLYGIDFNGMPDPFPFASVAAARAFYWLTDRDADKAKAMAREIYRGSFVDLRDMTKPDAIADAAAKVGVDRAELLAALQEAEVKDRLRAEVEAAVADDVFGSPFFSVGGEAFWGADRLNHLEQWLARGGW